MHKENTAISKTHGVYVCLHSKWHVCCDVINVMSIRIDNVHSGSETVVHIAGRLSGTAVAQLKAVCEQIEGPAVLDLSSLLFVDDEGVETILASIEKGARIKGASPFIELLLGHTAQGNNGREPQNFIWV